MNLHEGGKGEDAGSMAKIDGYVRLCHGDKRIQGYLHAIPLPTEKATNVPKTKGANPARKAFAPADGCRFLPRHHPKRTAPAPLPHPTVSVGASDQTPEKVDTRFAGTWG